MAQTKGGTMWQDLSFSYVNVLVAEVSMCACNSLMFGGDQQSNLESMRLVLRLLHSTTFIVYIRMRKYRRSHFQYDHVITTRAAIGCRPILKRGVDGVLRRGHAPGSQ